jgi:hypothetical protein
VEITNELVHENEESCDHQITALRLFANRMWQTELGESFAWDGS